MDYVDIGTEGSPEWGGFSQTTLNSEGPIPTFSPEDPIIDQDPPTPSSKGPSIDQDHPTPNPEGLKKCRRSRPYMHPSHYAQRLSARNRLRRAEEETEVLTALFKNLGNQTFPQYS